MTTACDEQAIALGRRWAQALLRPHERVPAAPAAAPGGRSLLAIGDSWFAGLPSNAALDCLQHDHGYTVYSAARPGARLAEMDPLPPQRLAPCHQLHALAARMAAVPAAERARVLALLISAGGNDAIDDPVRFASMLNPGQPGNPINEAGVNRVVDLHVRGLLTALLTAVTQLSVALLGRKLPILIHGYAHPVPDALGTAAPGVSLHTTLARLGYTQPAVTRAVMARLVDRFNTMQQGLLAQNPVDFQHVSHIDLRPVLRNDEDYRQSWADELHPSIPRGSRRIAEALRAKLETLAAL